MEPVVGISEPAPKPILVPPQNFACVDRGIYRSSFPKKKNFPFLKRLGIKTIIFLCPEDYPSSNLEFLESINARLLTCGVEGNKEPATEIPVDVFQRALCEVLNEANHPVLIHCNKGKHRTGCLVGCFRRLQCWSLTAIFEEYKTFAAPKQRFVDQQFIELFDVNTPELRRGYRSYEERKAEAIVRHRCSTLNLNKIFIFFGFLGTESAKSTSTAGITAEAITVNVGQNIHFV
jgi:tyrosine-protein phosphatase SIW14